MKTTTEQIVRLLLIATIATMTSLGFAENKKIVLIAGSPSHGPGDHEFRAGCMLLQKSLGAFPGIDVEVHNNGWPQSNSLLDNADAVILYADGGDTHPFFQDNRPELIDRLVAKGIGIGCIHYSVDASGESQGAKMDNWIGGHYEHAYTANPIWIAQFNDIPTHPVTNGVKPFELRDEWYFNIRFRQDDIGSITPILFAKPSDKTREGPYMYPKGPFPHILANKGRTETLMWTYEHPNGSRGFGTTGGHMHKNWGNENFRKATLNAILWTAGITIPEQGVESIVTNNQLQQNLDSKK